MHLKKLIIIVGLIIAAITSLLILDGCGKSQAGQSTTNTASSVETSSAVVNGKIDGHDTVGDFGSKVGQTQRIGDLNITVVRVITGTAIAKNNSVVTLQIANKGTATATVDPRSWSAIDRSAGDVPQIARGENDFATTQQVASGQTITRTLYFEGSNIGRIVYSADNANATQLTWHIQ